MAQTDTTAIPTVSRRRLIVLGGLAATGFGSAVANGELEDSPTEQLKPPHDQCLGPADAAHPDVAAGAWDPITIFDVNDRHLTSITLLPATSRMAYADRPPNAPVVRLKKVHYVSTDAELLAFLTTFLPNQPLCFAVPRDVGIGWGGSGMPLTLVRLRTNVDTFWVSITNIGFALGSAGADSSNIFFSPTLAMALSSVYKKASGSHFPQRLIDALSGKTHLEKEFKRFSDWQMTQE